MLIGISLNYLNDKKNAYIAFERSVMMPEAIKNPLIYLNFSIFCYKSGDDDKIDKARLYLGYLYKMKDTIHINREV